MFTRTLDPALRAKEDAIGPRPRLVAWLAPDLSITFALITLIASFLIFGSSTAFFNDAATGWHLRDGEQILSTGQLPHADKLSFSKPGEPFIAWEWGSDVVMAAVFRVSGFGGVALLFGLCIAACVWMWFRLSRAAGGNSVLACLFFLPLLATTKMHWVARPHVFSWLLLLGTVWVCEGLASRPGWRHLMIAAMAGALWANVHASFFLAPLIALVYAVGAYSKPLIWDERGLANHEVGGCQARDYVMLALALSVGTLANPHGWRLHQHVVSFLSDSRMLDQIMEFRSFDFHLPGASQVMLTLAICSAGGFAAWAARKPERFLLSMILTVVALRSLRVLPVAAWLLLPLANGSITAALVRAGHLTRRARRIVNGALGYGNRLESIGLHFHGFAIVPMVAGMIFVAIRAQAGFPVNVFPVAASAMVSTLPAGARILAPDTFGSYLIFRFGGERKVFIDERNDFYGSEFIDSYQRLMEVQPGWRTVFNRWDFTDALLPSGHPLIPALEDSGWRELYRDRTAVLLTGRPKL